MVETMVYIGVMNQYIGVSLCVIHLKMQVAHRFYIVYWRVLRFKVNFCLLAIEAQIALGTYQPW